MKALPLRALLSLGSEQRGVCFKQGLSGAFSILLFYTPVTLIFSQALGIFAACFPPPAVNDDWRLYPVTLYSSVSCTLWWCQMAASTNPVPCSERSLFTSRKQMGARSAVVGISSFWSFLMLGETQKSQKLMGPTVFVSNIDELHCKVEIDRRKRLMFQPESSSLLWNKSACWQEWLAVFWSLALGSWSEHGMVIFRGELSKNQSAYKGKTGTTGKTYIIQTWNVKPVSFASGGLLRVASEKSYVEPFLGTSVLRNKI